VTLLAVGLYLGMRWYDGPAASEDAPPAAAQQAGPGA
jgi:hypothetical protein